MSNTTEPPFELRYLDRGRVSLLSCMGCDRTIAEAAWVSSDRGSARPDADVAKIVGYLARHGHWTPFAQTALTFRFRIPIFIARQLMRSNVGIVWNEESRRYVSDEPEFFYPTWRLASDSMKQGSAGPCGIREQLLNTEYLDLAYQSALVTYRTLLHDGVAPEQARVALPVGTYTTLVGTFSLASLARVYKLRCHPHAQQEIQELASCINSAVLHTGAFPVAWSALTT